MIRLRPQPVDWDYALNSNIQKYETTINIPYMTGTNYTQYSITHSHGVRANLIRVLYRPDISHFKFYDFTRPTSTSWAGVRSMENGLNTAIFRVYTTLNSSGHAGSGFPVEIYSLSETA